MRLKEVLFFRPLFLILQEKQNKISSISRHRGLERRRELLHRDARGRARDRCLFASSSSSSFFSAFSRLPLPPEQNRHLRRERRLPLFVLLDGPDLEDHPSQPGPGQKRAAGQGGADLLLEPLAEGAVSLRVEDERRKGGGGGGGGGGGWRGFGVAVAARVSSCCCCCCCCRGSEASRASRSRGRRERGRKGGRGRGRTADDAHEPI